MAFSTQCAFRQLCGCHATPYAPPNRFTMVTATLGAAAANGEHTDLPAQPAWMTQPVTGEVLHSVIQLVAARSNAPEVAAHVMSDFMAIMESSEPSKAVSNLLKTDKRGRSRPKSDDQPPKRVRDLGSYNLFFMKAQNVADGEVKNHRAFTGLIGSFWKVLTVQSLDQETREEFNTTYKGLLDILNEKKKAGVKYDFAHELKAYEHENELDPNTYFKGFMAQVRNLPLPPQSKADREAEAKAEAKEARAAANAKLASPQRQPPANTDISSPAVPAQEGTSDSSDSESDEDEEPAPPPKPVPAKAHEKKKKKKRAEEPQVVAAEEPKKKKKKKDKEGVNKKLKA